MIEKQEVLLRSDSITPEMRREFAELLTRGVLSLIRIEFQKTTPFTEIDLNRKGLGC